jgi:hypothetical protein
VSFDRSGRPGPLAHFGHQAPPPETRPVSRSREHSYVSSEPLSYSRDDVVLNVDARGCLDKQVRQDQVVIPENLAAVDAVAVQYPSCEKEGRPLVALGESLSPRNPKRQQPGGCNRVRFVFDRSKGFANAVQIVRLLEPFVGLPHAPVYLYR